MTLDEVLTSLFPEGHSIARTGGLLTGHAELAGTRVDVIGVADRLPFGIDEAVTLASHVLDTIERGGDTPILVLVDSDSQRMSKRDELLGLNECLSHLAKCLMHAELAGHRTIGLLYGHTAAGAFIATALATRTLLAVPGAYFWLGHDGDVPLHNPGFILDDKILPVGASLFSRIIEKRLPLPA